MLSGLPGRGLDITARTVLVYITWRVLLMADKPSNGGTTDQGGTQPPAGKTPNPSATEDTPSANKGQEANPAANTEGQDGQETVSLTKRKLSGIITRREKKAVDTARQQWEAEQADQRATIEREAREKAGEWQPLYEGEKAKVANLTQQVKELQAALDELRDSVDGELADKIKDWPDEVLETDPATLSPDGYTAKERQDWYNRMSKIVARMNGNGHQPPRTPGNGPSPAPADHSTQVSQEEQAYINQRRAQRGAGTLA